MSIFNRAYLYIIRKKVRSSILFLIVTLISFFLLSGSVLNTTVNNISKNLYKDVNFGFNIESADKFNKIYLYKKYYCIKIAELVES